MLGPTTRPLTTAPCQHGYSLQAPARRLNTDPALGSRSLLGLPLGRTIGEKLRFDEQSGPPHEELVSGGYGGDVEDLLGALHQTQPGSRVPITVDPGRGSVRYWLGGMRAGCVKGNPDTG